MTRKETENRLHMNLPSFPVISEEAKLNSHYHPKLRRSTWEAIKPLLLSAAWGTDRALRSVTNARGHGAVQIVRSLAIADLSKGTRRGTPWWKSLAADWQQLPTLVYQDTDMCLKQQGQLKIELARLPCPRLSGAERMGAKWFPGWVLGISMCICMLYTREAALKGSRFPLKRVKVQKEFWNDKSRESSGPSLLPVRKSVKF